MADSLAPADLDATLQSIMGTAVRVLPQVDYAILVNHAKGRLEEAAEARIQVGLRLHAGAKSRAR